MDSDAIYCCGSDGGWRWIPLSRSVSPEDFLPVVCYDYEKAARFILTWADSDATSAADFVAPFLARVFDELELLVENPEFITQFRSRRSYPQGCPEDVYFFGSRECNWFALTRGMTWDAPSFKLGQDFDSEAGYLRARERPESNATWRNLLPVLCEVGIKPEECFFTNFYMGLREGQRATGEFPGSRYAPFVQRCVEFFLRRQLQEYRPRLVITLGGWVPRLLARLSENLRDWQDTTCFQEIDASLPRYTGALRVGVRFSGAPLGVSPTVVAFVHPSYRRINVKWRRFEDAHAELAEARMLRRARSLALRR